LLKKFLLPLLVLTLVVALLTSAYAIDLGDLAERAILGGIIALIVDRFSGQLNDFINTLMMHEKLAPQEATKVVPIISMGKALYVGAAQVVGPRDKVNQVQAVAQLEGGFRGEQFRVKALVPITERGKVTNLQRVQGVGISAVIDVKP